MNNYVSDYYNYKKEYIKDHFFAYMPTVVFSVLGLIAVELKNTSLNENLYFKMNKEYFEAIKLYKSSTEYNDVVKVWKKIQECFLVILEMKDKVFLKPIITEDDFNYNLNVILKDFGIHNGIDDVLRKNISSNVKEKIKYLIEKAKNTKNNNEDNNIDLTYDKILEERNLLLNYLLNELLCYDQLIQTQDYYEKPISELIEMTIHAKEEYFKNLGINSNKLKK